MVSNWEIQRAYRYGLQTKGDPEVLREMGIPASTEDVASHLESSVTVRTAIDNWPSSDKPKMPFCGDCLTDVVPGKQCPGGHMKVAVNGLIRVLG